MTAVSLSLSAALLLLALGAGLVFAYTRVERDERRVYANRVTLMIGAASSRPADIDKGEAAVRRQRAYRWLRWPFSIGLRRTWGIKLSTLRLYFLACAGAAAGWLLVHGLLHLPAWTVFVAVAAIFLLGPRAMLVRQQHSAEQKFTELFPDSIDMIVRMVRAGLPVALAIRAVGEQGIPPVSEVFAIIADRTDIGVPLEKALSDTGEDVGLADFRFFAVAVGLQRSTGGNLAKTLELFGEIVRKRRAVRLKARAATAEVRMSAMVLAAIPFLVVLALAVINPGYLLPLLSDPRGNVLIGAAMLSLLLGGLVMRWIIRAGTRV